MQSLNEIMIQENYPNAPNKNQPIKSPEEAKETKKINSLIS
jgi:hypothetical protein